MGDFCLAHAYLREDHVLDDDLPIWVPIPALAEIQIALEEAVAEVTQLKGYELKRIMRTGTVATIDNRNWELRDQSGPVRRLSVNRAPSRWTWKAPPSPPTALGSAFPMARFCVSADKPLHGELKLPGMASEFYKTQVSRHLQIGIRAMEHLRDMPIERIHSRKLAEFRGNCLPLTLRKREKLLGFRDENPLPCRLEIRGKPSLIRRNGWNRPLLHPRWPKRRTYKMMTTKPMTKTQLVAAIADAMGADKKTAGALHWMPSLPKSWRK